MSLFGLFKKDEEHHKEKPHKNIKDTSFYSQSDTTLPENFAQSVMEL
jgi:hypothetical protein